jgi:hypothetical protein
MDTKGTTMTYGKGNFISMFYFIEPIDGSESLKAEGMPQTPVN